MTLSARGAAMASGALPPYLQAHMQRQADEGYVPLSVAENLQVWDLLAPRLNDLPPLPPEAVSYDDGELVPRLRHVVAELLGREVFGRPIDPGHVRALAGASSVLDALGHVLGDPGDGVLVPTPSYAGFWFDFETRPGMQMMPVPTVPDEGFALTPERLDRAVAASAVTPRILLLTNPDNPRGQIRPAEEVEAALAWAQDRGLHVIADEIYALSVFADDQPFPSVGRLRDRLGDRLHVVWAVSKDLGMSGMRTGFVVSENADLRPAVEVQSLWGGVGGMTAHAMATLLGDRGFLDAFLPEMRRRLADAATDVTGRLTAAAVPHLTPTAGFFVLCDLRGFLQAPTWEAEEALWREVLDGAGVNLTPGSALRSPEPGWFRLCYAARPREVVAAAVDRVLAVLAA